MHQRVFDVPKERRDSERTLDSFIVWPVPTVLVQWASLEANCNDNCTLRYGFNTEWATKVFCGSFKIKALSFEFRYNHKTNLA